MKRWIAVAVVLSTALLSPAREAPVGSLTGHPAAAAEASNRFGLDLYARLRTTPGNLFFSPYSISVAFDMTRAGARGTTRSQMDTVLHLESVLTGAAHPLLMEALRPVQIRDGRRQNARKRPSHEIHIANALWGQEGLGFEKPFLDQLDKAYGAPLERIDFAKTEAARERINSWVAKETKERIRDIIPPGLLSSDTLIALANAIHFKAAWKKPFPESSTRDAPFWIGAGAVVNVPTMRTVAQCGYAETPEAQILEIDYLGGETSMVVILPKTKDGLAAIEKSLNGAELTRLLVGLQSTTVDVRLPKFSFTSFFDLTKTLPAMGMKDAFDPRKADFTGMTKEEPLFIGLVLHKAFVAVDEKGTEAAAATVVTMKRGGGRPSGTPLVFNADHPFLFLVGHRDTGCVLFLGRVVDPSAK